MPESPGEQSWVTTALDDAGSLAALVLARSLRRVITTRKITVLTSSTLSTSIRNQLEEEFDVVLDIDTANANSNASLQEHAKVYCWKLTFFRKCVYLDVNTLVLENCDELFSLKELSAIPEEQNPNVFDSSLFVFSPSFKTYNEMGKKLQNKGLCNGSTNGLDILKSHFRNSAGQKKWNVLPGIYNTKITTETTFDKFHSGVKIIQLKGEKSWENSGSKKMLRNRPYDVLSQVWLNIYNEDLHEKITARIENHREVFKGYNGILNGPINTHSVETLSKEQTDGLKDSVAIVGLSCRYPGANNAEEFWNLLIEGKDAIQVVPADRWNEVQSDDTDDAEYRRTKAGFLKCPVDEFDSKFFGISPREAAFMDPQQRLLLEVAWEGLENAGINPAELKGSNTGVFIGVWTADYERMLRSNVHSSEAHRIYLGNSYSATSARISFCLGLNGPNIATESGCSSSFVSLHLACDSLRKSECNLAVAGGVNLLLHPFPLEGPGKPYFLSPDGHCKTFDENANGFGRAEGCGVVILKRLSDAVRDGDRVLALVRGSAVSSEGTTASFGTPSRPCQEMVIKEALRNADVVPSTVSFVETHGTGTIVGDPIEVSAIASTYSEGRKEPLVIGSVKTNIGHSEGAAGVAGLIKVILALQNEIIPPHRNFSTLNPIINLEEIPALIPLQPHSWKRDPKKPRRAGISSFGISGTNVHVVVEEAPILSKVEKPQERKFHRPQHLLTISAKTENALSELVTKYCTYLKYHPNVRIEDVAYVANTGRAHLTHRLAIVGRDAEQMITQLEKKRFISGKIGVQKPLVALLFTGQGSQYIGMAKQLYLTNPVFKNALDKSTGLVQDELGVSLLDAIWSEDNVLVNNNLLAGDEKLSSLDQTLYSQTSIFCIEYSLFELWKSFGIVPDYVLGHSVGEFPAAVAAGIMTVEEAVKLVCQRSRLIQSLPPGGMLAVKSSEENVRSLINSFTKENENYWLDVAVINSGEEVVVAGKRDTLQTFSDYCTEKEIKTQRVAATHAFHSRAMDGMVKEFGAVAAKISYKKPNCFYVSGKDGKVIQDGSTINAKYWQNHARENVNFVAGMKTLFDSGCRAFLEIGAHPVLLALSLTNVSASDAQEAIWLPSIRRNEDEWVTMLSSLGKLYVNGVKINWRNFDGPYPRTKVELPSYPFQRQKFWFEPIDDPGTLKCNTKILHPLLGKHVPLATNELGVTIFQHSLALDNLGYLNDHQVANKIILPGAGFLEMIAAAGYLSAVGVTESLADPVNPIVITDFSIDAPMEILSEKNVRVQIVSAPVDNDKNAQLKINVYRKSGMNESQAGRWKKHATATVSATPSKTNEIPSNEDLNIIKARCSTEISTEEIYKKAPEIGIYFGPNFQSISKFWKGEKEILAELVHPADTDDNRCRNYICHPVVLDALIQTFALRIEEEKTALYLPIGVEKFIWHSRKQSLTKVAYGHLKWENENVQTDGSVTLLDDQGRALATMKGVRLVRTSVSAFVNFLNSQKKELPGLYHDVFRPKTGPLMSRIDLKLALDLESLRSSLEECFQTLRQRSHHREPRLQTLDNICNLHILKTLYQLGWEPKLGEVFQTRDLMTTLLISTRHESYFESLLEMLAQEGTLTDIGEEERLKEWKIAKMPPQKNDIPHLLEEQRKKHAVIEGEGEITCADFAVVERCGVNLGNVIQEKESPHAVLFPEDENITSAFKMYSQTDFSEITHEFMQKCCETIFSSAKASGNVIRVLEIGAGTGSTSAYIFEAFKKVNLPFSYTFTDISPTLLNTAALKFKDISRISYRLLNVEKDPKPQGFAPSQYDLVIASNVLHATQDLRETMVNIRHLLAPTGYTMIFEQFKKSNHIDFIFGQLDGYWRFKDLNLRGDHPMISAPKWETLLKETGFSSTQTYNIWTDRFGVVVGRASEECPQYDITNIPLTTAESSLPSWILFSNDHDYVSDRLFKNLKRDGRMPLKVLRGTSYEMVDTCRYHVNPVETTDFTTLFKSIESRGLGIEGIVYLWGNDAEEKDMEEISAGLLHTAQSLLVSNFKNLKVFLVSQGMYYIGDQETSSPVIGALRGMMQVLKNEQPGYRCVCVDLDPEDEDIDSGIHELYDEFWSQDKEHQIAFRQRKRFVLRVVAMEPTPAPLLLPNSERFKLKLPDSHQIQDITFCSSMKQKIDENSVEIQVKAVGLNFRDIFVIMKPDMFKTQVNEVGMEFSGVVTSIGSQVRKFRPGDEVFGVSFQGCLASHIVVNKDTVMRKSPTISFADAVTMPVVFLTAYYCLVAVAAMKPTDTILIHVASGGVGLAALQIANQIGATVIATAGSKRKRTYLKNLGIKHIFHSRNTNFGDEILAVTNGKGVDIVLNSLTGPNFKETSLRICKPNAKFVEMSKINIWQEEEVAKLRPDVAYTIVNLETQNDLGDMLEKIEGFVHKGMYMPLPYTRFDVSQIKEAFTYLQQAHHIGKVIVTNPDLKFGNGRLDTVEHMFNATSTYLVTGGLGGIGLEVAKFLAGNGARYIVLVGRSPPTPKAEDTIRTLNSQGARVLVLQFDIGEARQCEELFNTLKSTDFKFPPVRGIMHAAGVLSDGMITNQTLEKYKIVYNPKVNGVWNLHRLSIDMNLEHFVLFSSGAALLGTLGQSNHAAANAFLDTFACYRHALGLPAQTINWGIWSDIGAAAGLAIAKEGLLGIKPFSPALGIAALKNILKYRYLQVAVLELDNTAFKDIFQLGAYAEELISSAGEETSAEMSAEGEKIWNEIMEAAPDQRAGIIKLQLESLIRQTLKLPEDEPIDEHQNFSELGLDSLMAVEMRNRLQIIFGKHLTLNSTALLDHPNVYSLSNYLGEMTLNASQESPAPQQNNKEPESKKPVEKPTVKKSEQEIFDEEEIQKFVLSQWVKEDSILPKHIRAVPNAPCTKKPTEFEKILLTGASGQLGIYLLSELSQMTHLKTICLIRAKSAADGKKRIMQKLRKFDLLQKTNLDRIEFLPGNVTEKGLGMVPEKYKEMVGSVDAIIHCAIKGNHTEKYKKFKPSIKHDIRSVNVFGLVNVLEFASEVKTKHVLHASSFVAVGDVTEDGRISEELPSADSLGENIKWGYALTKFVSEKLIKQAIDRGIPCHVLRYPLLVGHSVSGLHIPESNHLMLFFFACRHLGLAPQVSGAWSSLPVDIAADITMRLFFNEKTEIGAYNITNPYVANQDDLLEVCSETSTQVKVVSHEEWLDGIANKGEASFLYPLRDIYTKGEGLMAFIRSSPATELLFTDENKAFAISPKIKKYIPNVETLFPKTKDILRTHMDYAKRAGLFKMFGLD